MFLSPGVGIIVSLGATVGFFVAGFPLVIVFRAFTHVLFAYIGGKIIKKRSTKVIEDFKSSVSENDNFVDTKNLKKEDCNDKEN